MKSARSCVPARGGKAGRNGTMSCSKGLRPKVVCLKAVLKETERQEPDRQKRQDRIRIEAARGDTGRKRLGNPGRENPADRTGQS